MLVFLHCSVDRLFKLWVGPIQTAGKILPVIVFLFITGMGFLRKIIPYPPCSLQCYSAFRSIYYWPPRYIHGTLLPLNSVSVYQVPFPDCLSATVMLSYSALW